MSVGVQYCVSITVNRHVDCMSRTAYYYKSKLSGDSEVIEILNELNENYTRWDFSKCFKPIRKLDYL